MIRLTHNLRAFAPRLANKGPVQRQLPFAASQALNDTGGEVKGNTERRMPRVLDRPTAFTKRGLFVKRSSKHKLQTVVAFKDRQAEYLELQEEGGTRTPRRRAILVPSKKRQNRFGNLPRGAVQKMLARDDHFSGTIRGVAGIWRRYKDGRIELQVSYADHATYRKALGFKSGARATAGRRFPYHFARRFDQAMRSAR